MINRGSGAVGAGPWPGLTCTRGCVPSHCIAAAPRHCRRFRPGAPTSTPVTQGLVGAQRRQATMQLKECREPRARGIIMRQYCPWGVPRGPLLPIAIDSFSNHPARPPLGRCRGTRRLIADTVRMSVSIRYGRGLACVAGGGSLAWGPLRYGGELLRSGLAATGQEHSILYR